MPPNVYVYCMDMAVLELEGIDSSDFLFCCMESTSRMSSSVLYVFDNLLF